MTTTESHSRTAPILQLKITLLETKPPVWRRVEVPGGVTLFILHRIVQEAMGWEGYHLYRFEAGGVEYGEPDPELPFESAHDTRLQDVVQRQRDRLRYEYDFGDGWMHRIEVEKVLDAEPGRRYPVCTGGRRACPPEDCGGPPGYAELVEIMKDPRDERYRDMVEWLGGRFDPAAFDLQAANERLRRASGAS